MYGSVRKGPRYTRFHVEVEMRRGIIVEQNWVESNDALERFPKLYGAVLDMITTNIDARIQNLHLQWMDRQ